MTRKWEMDKIRRDIAASKRRDHQHLSGMTTATVRINPAVSFDPNPFHIDANQIIHRQHRRVLANRPDIRFNLATDWQKSPSRARSPKPSPQPPAATPRCPGSTRSRRRYHKGRDDWRKRESSASSACLTSGRNSCPTSRFAIQAENSAPTLFHQIRSFADAKQAVRSALGGDFGGQHNADIKAIAAPLYEGTLYGGADPTKGIVWSDDQLRGRFGLTDRQIRCIARRARPSSPAWTKAGEGADYPARQARKRDGRPALGLQGILRVCARHAESARQYA